MDVTVYTVEARKAGETDREAFHTEQAAYPASDFYTYDYEDARAYAQENKLIVIANTYTFEDSEPLDDYSEIPNDWAIVDAPDTDAPADVLAGVVDRFETEAEAREALAAGGYPPGSNVAHVPDPGEL